MVPNTEDPEEREFQIPDLRSWVQSHRRELVIAALTLINHWVKGGMKRGNLRMGSFSRWAEVMSGVMAANAYDQFMTNLPQLKSRVDTVRDAMREFVGGWYNTYQTQSVNAAQLLRLASVEVDDETGQEIGEGLLSGLLTANSKRGRANQLRNLLRKHTDRTFRLESSEPRQVGDAPNRRCKIENSGKRINGYMIYRLTEIPPESPPSFDSDEVYSGRKERCTEEERRTDERASDSSEPQSDACEKTAVSSPEEGVNTPPNPTVEEKGFENESETKESQKGSPRSMRFTYDAPKTDADGVSGQVNLKVNPEAKGSPVIEHGSLLSDSASDEASHNGTPQNHLTDKVEGISAAEAQAIEYVLSWLRVQAALDVKGTHKDLSSYQIAYIRSEANRQFGTDLVHEDIEALWEGLVKAAMPVNR